MFLEFSSGVSLGVHVHHMLCIWGSVRGFVPEHHMSLSKKRLNKAYFTRCLFIRFYYLFIYFVVKSPIPSKTILLLGTINSFFVVTPRLPVCFSPLPPALLCASADPSCGFFCQEDAKYQSLPTGAVVTKYTPVWEPDPIYPTSCTSGCTCENFECLSARVLCESTRTWICTPTATLPVIDSFHTSVQGPIFGHLPSHPCL